MMGEDGVPPGVSAITFRYGLLIMRLSGALTPAHVYVGELLLLVQGIRSMYRGVEAQRRRVASTDKDLCSVHFE
jgi:hypothetical protein